MYYAVPLATDGIIPMIPNIGVNMRPPESPKQLEKNAPTKAKH